MTTTMSLIISMIIASILVIFFAVTNYRRGKKMKELKKEEIEIYLRGYNDAMKEHALFVKNLIKYIENYNYREESKKEEINEDIRQRKK